MTRRRSISRTERVRIFDAAQGICHICAVKIDGVRDRWDIEHVIPLALGGDDHGANLRPAHIACHATKTPADVRQIAKAKRVAAKHTGARARPKNPLPGAKGSGWRKPLNGPAYRVQE